MRKITVILPLAALALLACGGEEGVTTPPDRVLANTPDNCIANVELAFNGGDVNLLKASLAPNFVFYFDPNDVGQIVNGYVIPASWTYEGFIQAATNMFRRAYSIELAVGEIPAPAPGETTHHAPNIRVDLLVMINETSGYRVYHGHCDFLFEQYDAGGGVKLWRLAKCWDHTSSSFGDVEPATLGRILAFYR